MADALDLRHRLPRTWAVLLGGGCEAWVARRVAVIARPLSRDVVHVVDDAVAEAIAGESPARVFEVAQAKVIEADPEGYAERLRIQLRRRFVSLSRVDEHGLQCVIARIHAGPAGFVDNLVDQVTDILDHRRDLIPHVPDDATRDELRAEAFGWLAHPAHPAQLADLLAQAEEEPDTQEEARVQVERPRPTRLRPRVVVHVHLSDAALHRWGVARVEGIGPVLVEELHSLFPHADVELKPVVDLADSIRVNAYEHPESVKERLIQQATTAP